MKSIDQEYVQFVWDSVISYLSSFIGLEELERYLSSPTLTKPETINDVYRQLLGSLRNRQGMPNTISPIDELENCFYYFDPKLVLRNYDSDWEFLFDEIKGNVKPPSRMDKSASRSYWVIFCKGAISSAEFLSQFPNVQSFDRFVRDFDESANTRPALPLVLAAEIYGLGFALACDFLKELGYLNFSKPDTHVKYILSNLGFSFTSDLGATRIISEIAKLVERTPFEVDKGIWLIGSGDLYFSGEKIATDRELFVRETCDKWENRNL